MMGQGALMAWMACLEKGLVLSGGGLSCLNLCRRRSLLLPRELPRPLDDVLDHSPLEDVLDLVDQSPTSGR